MTLTKTFVSVQNGPDLSPCGPLIVPFTDGDLRQSEVCSRPSPNQDSWQLWTHLLDRSTKFSNAWGQSWRLCWKQLKGFTVIYLCCYFCHCEQEQPMGDTRWDFSVWKVPALTSTETQFARSTNPEVKQQPVERSMCSLYPKGHTCMQNSSANHRQQTQRRKLSCLVVCLLLYLKHFS